MQTYAENVPRKRKRTKRYLAAIIAVIMALSISTIALADDDEEDDDAGERSHSSQRGESNGSGGSGGSSGSSSSSGSQSQKKTDATSSATVTPKGNGNSKAQSNNKDTGINTGKIEDAIAALTNTDVQQVLTALLDSYKAALEAKQTAVNEKNTEELDALTAAVTAAKEALDTALEAAGVDTDTLFGDEEEAKDGSGKTNGNRPALNTSEIETAIAALTDTDAQATLTALLTTYEEALAAQTAADTSTLTDDEIQALADAVLSAENALLEAARDAGIIGGLGRGQFVDGHAYGKDNLDTEAISALIAALDDTDENKATLTELLAAYETALAAETTADTSSLTEEEIAALSEATETAAEALKTAMETAGIADDLQPSGTPQPMNQQQGGKEYQTSVISQNSGTTSSETTSVISSFLSWLSSLLD